MKRFGQAFKAFVTEPAFSMGDTTFCIWRGVEDSAWKVGNVPYPVGEDPDSSGWMLLILDGYPGTDRDWAEGYYEHPISLSAVKRLYEYSYLTPEIVRGLNPNKDFASTVAEAEEIGYPIACYIDNSNVVALRRCAEKPVSEKRTWAS
jgi:hypothetical protein